MKIKYLAAIAALFAAQASQAVTITFDSVAGSGTIYEGSLVFDGYQFSSEHFHLFGDRNGLAASGSTWMGEEGGTRGGAITMTQVGGGAFSLLGLFAGEFDPFASPAGFPNATYFDIVGTTTTGATVSAHLALDGIVDGRFGLPDLQEFTLNNDFLNLVSVRFSGSLINGNPGGMSMDNIRVQPSEVPEPATLALFGSGLGLLGIAAARKRRAYGFA